MPAERSLTTHTANRGLHNVDTKALARMSMAALDELFAKLEPAKVGELQGHKRGQLLALRGLDFLPGAARQLLMNVINRLPIWSGERFEGEFGTNAWILPGSRIEFAHYLVREHESLDDGSPVLRLDYDVAPNPKLLRDLVAELRELKPGVYLARTRYRIAGRAPKVSYFLLVP